MLAIQTRFYGPTNTLGARIKAEVCENEPGKRVAWVGYDHGMNSDDAHKAAVVALVRKLEWTEAHGYGPWVIGHTERGIVAVCNTRHGDALLSVK